MVPAYLLWRRRVASAPWTRASFVIVCTLGCALVMLFPVVSASDDLHAAGQAMEESERGFRHCGHCGWHALSHATAPALSASASSPITLDPVAAVLLLSQHATVFLLTPPSSGRAPPVPLLLSL